MHRRTLLKAGLALAAPLAPFGRLWAAPEHSARLLLVFLRGGYDSANVLVPYSASAYYESRPTLAIPRPVEGASSGALALDSDWALAPALRDSLSPFYASRQLAFIPFAGTDDTSRSHFETQDTIELGQPVKGPRNYRSGFLARLAAQLNGDTAIAFTDALPLIFTGPSPIPNQSLRNVGKPPFDARQTRLLAQMYADHPLQPSILEGLELRQEVAQVMAEEMRAASRDAISTKGFELEAERMGRLMSDRYRIGFVDVGGWDTHVNQGAAQGALATNLEALGKGLQSFAHALGPQWSDTVVVVISEFGRTFSENGSHGTDHGHGTVYWIMGGSLQGGRVAGEQVPVRRSTLFQSRDYPVLNDYRDVLGGLFKKLWGLSQEQLEQIFPQSTPRDLALV